MKSKEEILRPLLLSRLGYDYDNVKSTEGLMNDMLTLAEDAIDQCYATHSADKGSSAESEHKIRLSILEKHLGSMFYRTGELHNGISSAMHEYAQQGTTSEREHKEKMRSMGNVLASEGRGEGRKDVLKKLIEDLHRFKNSEHLDNGCREGLGIAIEQANRYLSGTLDTPPPVGVWTTEEYLTSLPAHQSAPTPMYSREQFDQWVEDNGIRQRSGGNLAISFFNEFLASLPAQGTGTRIEEKSKWGRGTYSE